MNDDPFRKAIASTGNGACVEVAARDATTPETIPQDDEVVVYTITDPADMPAHKTGETQLWVMSSKARPEQKMYFTDQEWDAFTKGVADGEFDLDENGMLPPVVPGTEGAA